VVITAENDRKAIADMSPYAKMTAHAAAAIVPCVDMNRGNAAGEEEVWWAQDLSAATENILLQITEEGLGGVWLGWYPDKARITALSRHLSLPSPIIPFAVIALGYPANPIKPADRFDPAKVHYGVYGKHTP
jgi:nitroreductase